MNFALIATAILVSINCQTQAVQQANEARIRYELMLLAQIEDQLPTQPTLKTNDIISQLEKSTLDEYREFQQLKIIELIAEESGDADYIRGSVDALRKLIKERYQKERIGMISLAAESDPIAREFYERYFK